MKLISCILFAVDLYETILEVSLLFICMLINVCNLWNTTSVVWKDIS